MEPWAAAKKKKLLASVAVPPAPVWVNGHLPRMLRQSANGKDDNEIVSRAVHRPPGICLIAEENPRKPQLGDRPMKGLCDQSSPQMGSLSSK